jgi:rare lipoprotein A
VRRLLLPLLAAISVGLSACFSTPPRNVPAAPAVAPPAAAQPGTVPPPQFDPDSVPDAVPRVEARSRYGNPPVYEVFGKRYYVLSSNRGYSERGVASWYGPGFHKIRTSTGEPYDMYAMTAAHKTLPLPAYVRVTNLQNGRSVVVRVNDRGPFVGNRIIDLSYTAAAKLDMLRNGTAFVEVRSIDPDATAPVKVGNPLFVQAGAFGDPANAQRLAQKLRSGAYGNVFVRDDQIAGRRMYRVRIGPVPNVAEFDRVVAALERDGVPDARLALD